MRDNHDQCRWDINQLETRVRELEMELEEKRATINELKQAIADLEFERGDG